MTVTYHVDEGALPLLPGFVDKTINVFEWSLAGSVVVVAVHREVKVRGESFFELAERITDETMARLGGHLEDSFEPAPELEVTTLRRAYRHWNEHEQLFHQQVFVDLETMALVVSGTSPARLRSANERLVDTAVARLRLRGPYPEPWRHT